MTQRLLLQTGLTATKISSEVGPNGTNILFPPLSRRRKRGLSHHYQSSATQVNYEGVTGRVGGLQQHTPLGQRAKQKQADKEFFVDVLNSAATKRDAKAYISRLKSLDKSKPSQPQTETKSAVNLGNLFNRTKAIDASPVFSQHALKERGFEEQELQHIALVKLSEIDNLTSQLLHGIAQTLSQLSRLSMAPCVIVGMNTSGHEQSRRTLTSEAERLSSLLDTSHEGGARILDCIFNMSDTNKLSVGLPALLQAPLQRGQIPIVLPVAYSSSLQQMLSIPTDDAVLALVEELSGAQAGTEAEKEATGLLGKHAARTRPTSLDRIIVIDQAGGIPNEASSDGKHVFLNLQQEYNNVKDRLEKSGQQDASKHMSNLTMLKDALQVLPHSSSGLMTTPIEASNTSQNEHLEIGPTVGTRRQKNALIHNLLTDRPAYSASLPKTRLSRSKHTGVPPPVSTFVKRGMPLKLIPDPLAQPWTADTPRIKLTDSCIDLARLVYLINDSFNRELDTEKYLERVNNNIAGVIIAGDYEGGAILTWETPPGADPSDPLRQVPYLDKFAVLKKSQGAGGVADILFNAMVRTCFPHGVCWRSRKNNPVNKWYFERSAGTWKIPGTGWTMFWTTPGMTQNGRTFQDYEAVCRRVQPTWIEKKISV